MTQNEKYSVDGMSCAACVSHVDKAVRSVKGVKDCTVNLLTNSMMVTYDNPASKEKIISAVKKAGYSAKSDIIDDELKDTLTPKLLKILIASVILLIPLLYISMGYMLMDTINIPLGILKEKPLIMGLIIMVLSLAIMIINKRFYTSGIKSLFKGGGNMDTLVALGSGVAFIYSLVLMVIMFYYSLDGNQEKVMIISMNLSFETAGMIPTLITIGKTLEAYSKGKTTSAIKGLLKLAPKTAHVIRDDKEIDINIEEMKVGDTFIVKPGEAFPVDAIVIDGESSVDESMLTGESMPIDKTIGMDVSAATININGSLKCEAKRVGQETTINKIIEMVKLSSSTKTKISRIADKVSGIFIPFVLIVSLIIFTIWLFISEYDISYSLERGIAVLVISCPCALGLATPVAIMVGNGKSAKSGILFKSASALEETGKIEYVVLDKTGTITLGKPEITDIITFDVKKERLLEIAYSLETKSSHPLSDAIVEEAQKMNINLIESNDFNNLVGRGVSAKFGNILAYAGNKKLVESMGLYDSSIDETYNSLSIDGKTPIFIIYDNKIIGIIALRDKIKDDSKEAISLFKRYGVKTVMLTGDNNNTAQAIAKLVGVDEVISDVLPEQKRDVIIELKKKGKVMMIGDGINDSIALTEANIGMAIGAGSDIAIDSAEVVLMKSSLLDAVAAYNLSRYTLLNIKENLFWAFIYNIIMIPFAATSNILPWMGAAAMSLSSFCVCMNALRINLYNPYKIRSQKNNKEKVYHTFDLSIEGMMCENCVKHVKDAIESMGLDVIEVSLENNNALIKTDKELNKKKLIKTIKNSGYNIINIKEV